MSMDAGGLAQMTYNGFPSNGLGAPGSGFAARGGNRANNFKRLSVALPPKVNPISENQVDNPTPRTSRSHLLAGLRTQPKTPSVPASAPYNQTQHQFQGLSASKWADHNYNSYNQGVPQTATGAGFNPANQYAMNAGRQMYSLPEQVLAPPSVYGPEEEMDPNVLEHLQMTGMFLAQRQHQLQQQLASITAASQQFNGLNLNTNVQHHHYQQSPMTPQTPQNGYYGQQQQMQSPIEMPGQPGVYLVYNPATQGYAYAVDPNYQQQVQSTMSPSQGSMYTTSGSPPLYDLPTPSFRAEISPPPTEKALPMNSRSITPPKKAPSPPSASEHVEPLPPPSATAFRRGHKKASSLAISALSNAACDGPKTSSMATFGSQRTVFPPTPMTGTFGPGAARAGEHPLRQPRGPPPLEELTALPTSKHEGSKNFATRQRRRALDNLMRAGTVRRGVSHSPAGSPVSEGEYNFSISEEDEEVISTGSRKMSPIGSEMKEKRGSQGSADGYFGLSSGSGSETEDTGAFKQPPTPATPVGLGGERKKMMLGVLNAAEKRKSCLY